MAILSKVNSLSASLTQVSGFMNPQKNKREMLNAYKGYIIESDTMTSIIMMGCKTECISKGELKLIAENADNKYYQVSNKDIMILGVQEKYKILPLSCVEELKKYRFTYTASNGYFSTKYNGVTTCCEKIAAAHFLKCNVEEVRKYILHHKTLKCVNLPETLALLVEDEHIAGHKIVGRYARNQCIYIDNVEQFKQFMDKLQQQRVILAGKDFGLEF